MQTSLVRYEGTKTENMIYYNFTEGKRESKQAAVDRFYRLHWGGWIRTRAGRHKHLWKKPEDFRWWARQHVFLSREQSLDCEKMINPDIKKQRHFIDDPYEPYHKRHNFDVVPRGKFKVGTSYFKLMYEY